MIRFARSIGVIIALAAASAGPARAEVVYGIAGIPNVEGGQALVTFDSASPGVVTTVGALNGITPGELLNAIAFRPATGQLYAVSAANSAATLYTVNQNTGQLTTVGTFSLPAGFQGGHTSARFNPVTGGLRVVGWDELTGTTANLRINPATGAIVATDGTPAYATGDPNFGVGPPQLAALGYSNNFAGATTTTLYTWDWALDAFDRMGSLNGAPNSPNTGILETVNDPPGLGTFNPAISLDFSGATGTLYLTHDDVTGNVFSLFTVNPATGVETLVGNFPSGLNVLDIAVQPTAVPEPSALALVGLAAVGLASQTWRRTSRRNS